MKEQLFMDRRQVVTPPVLLLCHTDFVILSSLIEISNLLQTREWNSKFNSQSVFRWGVGGIQCSASPSASPNCPAPSKLLLSSGGGGGGEGVDFSFFFVLLLLRNSKLGHYPFKLHMQLPQFLSVTLNLSFSPLFFVVFLFPRNWNSFVFLCKYISCWLLDYLC